MSDSLFGFIGKVIKLVFHVLYWCGMFILKRWAFILLMFFLLLIAENQIVLMDSAAIVTNTISNIIPDLSFINDFFDCIDGLRLLWNTTVDVIQALLFVVSAAINSPITPFDGSRTTSDSAFDRHFAKSHFMRDGIMQSRVMTPRSIVDFCAYFIPMRDFLLDVTNIIFGGLRDILNELFVVFPNFPNLRSRVENGAWRVVDASGAFFDKRFSVIDALLVFITAIMQAFMDVFDPHFCFHPPEEFPATLWGCLGCGFNRTQAAASTQSKINAPIVCLCGGHLDDNTVILVIQCIGLAPLLSIYNNVLSKKDIFDNAMNIFTNVKNSAIALWNFVEHQFNTMQDDVKTIVHKFCSLDPTGLVCKVLGLRDGNVLCAYDTRSGGEQLLFCIDMDMKRMPHMSLNVTPLYTDMVPQQKLFSPAIYLEPPPAVPINPAFIPPQDDFTPRYTFRQILNERPGWMDQFASFVNALIDTAAETVKRGESPGVPYIVDAFDKRAFDPLHLREGVRDMVRRVGMKPSVTVISSPEVQERVVEFFGIAIAFATLAVGLSTLLLPAFLPCIILTLISLMTVMIIVLPAMAELGINTMTNFISGSLVSYDPFSFTLYQLKSTFLAGFTRVWTPAEIGTLFSDVAVGVGKALDMVGIYIFKSGAGIPMRVFGNGNDFPPPLYDTITGEPQDTILNYINSLINCVPTDVCFGSADCFNGGCNCVNGTLARGQSLCNEPGTCYCAPRLRKGTFSFPAISVTFTGVDPGAFGYVAHGVMWPIEPAWWKLPFRWMHTFFYATVPLIARVLTFVLHLGSLGLMMPCCACVCKCCKRQIGWLTKLSYIFFPLGLGINMLVVPAVDYCEFRSALYCRPVKWLFLPREVQSVEYILAVLNIGPAYLGAYCMYMFIVFIEWFFVLDIFGTLATWVVAFFEKAFEAPSWYIVARKSHIRSSIAFISRMKEKKLIS